MNEVVWLALLALAFPVMALVALVLALKQRQRLDRLEQRLAQVESTLASLSDDALNLVAEPPPPHSAEPAPLAHRRAAVEPLSREPETPPPTIRPRRSMVTRLRENFGGFEERIGARWTVWVGALALALGGVFLVRFAVEQNLIGPAARIGMGLALAALLLAGGEVLRRLDRREAFAALPTASVPSLLTAVGTMTAFGSLYAAYALYDLIPPPLAFVLLGLTGIATLLAALLHGPALAALGFAGAATTPLLISSHTPDAWGVALLIVVVGAAALGVARLRLWRWLAVLAMVGMAGWGAVLVLFAVPHGIPAAGVLAVSLLALTAALLTAGHLYGPPATAQPDLVATLGAALALTVAALAVHESGGTTTPLALFLLTVLGALALAWRAPGAAFAAVATTLAAPVPLLSWRLPAATGSALAPTGPLAGIPPEPGVFALGGFIAFGGLMGAVLLITGLAGARRGTRKVAALGWATAGTGGPILMLMAAYGRLAGLERSLPLALLALVLAAVFTWVAEQLARERRVAPGTAFAAGGVISLALALTFALEKGWLTVSLALSALAVAWVSTWRSLPGLRPLAAGLGLVVLGRVGWEPSIAGAELGSTPLFNWLLWGYGVPTLAFAGAARLLAPAGDDWSRRVLDGLALVFAVLLAALEVRHLAHGGDLTAPETDLFETGFLAAIYGAYAVGLARLAAVTGRSLYRLFSDLVAALAGLGALAALIAGNPFLTKDPVGGPVFNDLLVGYALPAMLALLYAAQQPATRQRVRLVASGLALVLALAYLTLQVSRAFQGPVLSADAIGASEWYAVSAVWLGFGMVLLGLGVWLGSRPLRLASAAVVVATVLKVFVSDMADLEGVLRALSFIGLGVVLVAMGWLYQHLLLPRSQAPGPAEPPEA